jgi:hypothetical protein
MMIALRYRSNFSLLISLIALSVFYTWPVRAGEPDTVSLGRELLQLGECVEAWEVLWPLAMAGNSEASSVVLSALYATLLPPVIDESIENYRKLNAFFAVTSIPFASGSQDFFEYRLVWLNYIWPENDPNRLGCVALFPPAECMGIAFDNGYAPSAQQVALEIQNAEKHGASASCKGDQY